MFEAPTPEETRDNILNLPIPDFRKLRDGVDDRLNGILQKSLQRMRADRYQTAREMLTALEVYLYSDGYGPTNEKLAEYLADIYADGASN